MLLGDHENARKINDIDVVEMPLHYTLNAVDFSLTTLLRHDLALSAAFIIVIVISTGRWCCAWMGVTNGRRDT